MFDPAYFDPGYFGEALPAGGFPPPSILLSDSPYFDHAYFDPAAFDTDTGSPTTPAGGGPRVGPRRAPAPNDDDFWMVLI